MTNKEMAEKVLELRDEYYVDDYIYGILTNAAAKLGSLPEEKNFADILNTETPTAWRLWEIIENPSIMYEQTAKKPSGAPHYIALLKNGNGISIDGWWVNNEAIYALADFLKEREEENDR